MSLCIVGARPVEQGQTIITVQSFCGEERTRLLPMAFQDFMKGAADYAAGALIQDAWPTLSPADREFMMTGMTEEDWAAMSDEEEEDEYADYNYDEYDDYHDEDCPGCG